jgi:glucose/arabinose dehydrogenase
MRRQPVHRTRLHVESLERRITPTNLPTGFREVPVLATGTSLTSPTAMEIAPDGQLWVLEQTGRVKLVRSDGTTHTALTLSVDANGERGLLGIAFEPGYDGAGPNADRVYLYHTVPASPSHNQITRYTVTGAGSDSPTLASPTVIRGLPPNLEDADTNHNGGAIHFGPDGKLYAAIGDHNYDTSPQTAHVSQILTTPFGKMLRLNPDGTNPSDNPFFSGSATDWRGAIWAMGLRNPFTFAFDASGQLFINDVGEGTWEEINKGEAAANYGWAGSTAPLWEGFEPTAPWTNYRDPLMAYDHSNSPPSPAGIAITGGVFYPANSSFGSAYSGKYFFSDFGADFIRVFDPSNPGSVATPDTSTGFATNVTGGAPVDLKVDSGGRLYFLARGTGKIYRIEADVPAITQQPVDVHTEIGGDATFTVVATGAAPLQYQWQKFNGTTWDAINGATSATFTIDPVALADEGDYRVVVSNTFGSVTSDAATLQINDLPTASIDAPDLFEFNQTINFSGTANDAEDGALPASAFRWRVDFHHDGQVQVHVPEFSGATLGSFVANAVSNALGQFYRIVLTVTDSEGASTTVTRDVAAHNVAVNIASHPAGVPVTVNGQPASGVVVALAGTQRTIAAPVVTMLGEFPYRFDRWSDGGAPTHTITWPSADTSLVANYARVTPGLKAEFFDFSTPLSTLPDLTSRTPDVTRTDAILSYTVTSLPWAGLGAAFADTFAARHTGLVRIDKAGQYRFFARSGDGSKMWLDGEPEPIIDNDGIHGMRERSAARTLGVGYHSIRVESFENTGTAGMILLWSGPGIVKQVIPGTRLFHDAPSASLAFRQDTGPDGLVVMEAENHDGSVVRNGRWWRDIAAPIGYSGVGAMRVPNAGVAFGTNFVTRSPRLDFRVEFLKAGTHYVWVRGRGPTTGDSLHVGLDGGAVGSAGAYRMVGLQPSYGWTRSVAPGGGLDIVVATIDVPTPGIHTVNVWMWEDGTIFDKLLLTTSASFVPTGTGPAESPRTGPALDFTGGFAGGASGLQLNGSALVHGSSLELTSFSANQAGSAFSSNPVNVTRFSTTFDFHLTSTLAQGFAFVIQGVGNTALGSAAGGLGYQGIGNSIAVTFDQFDNAGEGNNSTGLYTNGESPTGGGTDLTPSGINLHSLHEFRASISYAGGTLWVTIRDLVTGDSAEQSYAIDIPTLVGGNTAFVGFTGSTGSGIATSDIRNWGFWTD